MKKIILIIICCMLAACVQHSDFGKNIKEETIKKTTCTSKLYSQASCLEKAKEICPVKISAVATQYDNWNGPFYEVLYICADENKENIK